MPRCSVIRCEPAHRDLRPPASFWDCIQYAELLSGTAAASPLVAEPPQSAALRDESALPFLGGPGGAMGAQVGRAEPVPVAAAPVDTTAECTRGFTAVARYATTPVCRDGTKALPATDGSGLFTPLSPEFRGKGGGAPACKCECHCPPPLLAGFDTGLGGGFAGVQGEPVRHEGSADPQTQLYDPSPLGPRPFPGPTPPPLPGRRPRKGERAISLGPDERGARPFAEPVSDPRRIVISSDAPAENIFEGLCPWCGGVRGEDAPLPRPSQSDEAEPPASVEPPQFAEPGPVRTSPPPGSLSFGTTLPRGPSLHPTGLADADVLLPGGAGTHGPRRPRPAGE